MKQAFSLVFISALSALIPWKTWPDGQCDGDAIPEASSGIKMLYFSLSLPPQCVYICVFFWYAVPFSSLTFWLLPHIFSIIIIILNLHWNKSIANESFYIFFVFLECTPKVKTWSSFCLEVHYCLEISPHISYLWIKQGIISISFEKFIMSFEIPLSDILLHYFWVLEN